MGLLWGGDDLAIDKDKISQIKHDVNIVDIIGEVVPLTRSGRHYLGLCPFHKEKTPSFNVIEDKQFYHCFGCGKSGDVFKFIEDYRQVPFLESVQIVAEKAGIPLEKTIFQGQPKKVRPNQDLLDLHRDAVSFYQAVLLTTKNGQAARDYLYQRGLTDELIKHFQIGLAPAENDYLYQALSKKYKEDSLLASGLFNVSEQNNRIYDAFCNRIMFPLSDENGQPIAFSGRIWTSKDQETGQAKYKNSRATKLFNKSYELYHLDKAKPVITKTHEVFLMEGFMDVIAAYKAGVENAVASMGTALTEQHIRRLKALTSTIVMVYDGDAAGQNAIAKSLELLKDFNVEIVQIPNKLDPDEFVQKHSAQAFAQLLQQSRISHIEFQMKQLQPENSDNLQAQIAYVDKMAPIIAASPSITAQNTYIHKLADLLPDFDYFQVEQAVNQRRLQDRKHRQGVHDPTASVTIDLPLSKRLSALVKTETHLLHRLLTNDVILNEFRFKDHFQFDTPEFQVLFDLLKEAGEITSVDLSHQPEAINQAYYCVLEENLPKEIGPNEIEEVLLKRQRLLQERKIQQQGKQIRESSSNGNHALALETLEQLIAQRRNME
ncbi:DNA primase [Streptococcus halichoeri]|uniref:DNA primase n=1 Tax=Streptococcus halichoeri TaxID=254785 RepID=UPI0013584E8E|nr:DNA primase [Streptococcus halichoeri]